MEQGYISTLVDDPHAARPANLLRYLIWTDTLNQAPISTQ